MEDVSRPQQIDTLDEALSKKKKRRYFFGDDFESSWLAYRDAISSETEEPAKDESEEEGKESSKKRRWLKKFKSVFKRTVGLNKVDFTHEEDNRKVEWGQGSSDRLEVQAPQEAVASSELQDKEPFVTGAKESLDGELIISHEDEETPEVTLPVPADIPQTFQYMDYFNPRPEEILAEEETSAHEADVPDIMPNITAAHKPESDMQKLERNVDWNERYHKRQEQRLKKRVRKLKNEDKKLKHEQEKLEQRQKKMEQQIDGLTMYSPEANTVSTPVLGQETRFHHESPPTSAEKERIEIKPAQAVTNVEYNAPEHQEITEQPALKTDEISPEHGTTRAIQVRVEKAAEQNMPIEKIYEYRHEAKDEAQQTPHSSVNRTPDVYAPGGTHLYEKPWQPAESTSAHKEKFNPFGDSKPGQTNLYTRAARDGFITGVVILAIILVIGLAR